MTRMTKKERNSVKSVSDMIVEYQRNFAKSGIDPLIAGQMAVNVVIGMLKASTELTNATINNSWGIYGGKAD